MEFAIQPRSQAPIEMLLVTVKQAAEIIQVSERTIHKFVASGKLPSVKFGAIRRVELSAIKVLIASGRKETRGRKKKTT